MWRLSVEEVQLSNLSKKSEEAKYRRGANSRLFGNLVQLDMHLKSEETVKKHGNMCKVCGNVDYSKYSICGVYLHLMSNRIQAAGRTCFFDYHNDDFFVWHVQMQDFQKPKSKTGIIPHFLITDQMKGF